MIFRVGFIRNFLLCLTMFFLIAGCGGGGGANTVSSSTTKTDAPEDSGGAPAVPPAPNPPPATGNPPAEIEPETVWWTVTFFTGTSDTLEPLLVADGEGFTLPSLTKAHASLDGWALDFACTIPWETDQMLAADVDLYACWSDVRYMITVQVADSADWGSVTGLDATGYLFGDSAELQATAANGYAWDRWLEGSQELTSDARYRFAVAGNRTLTARFTPLPKLAIAGVDTFEGNSGTTAFRFLVALDRQANGDVEIFYRTEGDTATSGVDFQDTSDGLVVIPHGSDTAEIIVPVFGDEVPEQDEHFWVVLTALSANARLADTAEVVSSRGTIRNDDPFGFLKLGSGGLPLSQQEVLWSDTGDEPTGTQWGCARDLATGLVWEVKENDTTEVRHYGHTYSWYSEDATTNGGAVGTPNGGSCAGGTCDTAGYVAAVNASTLCSFTNWRMPTREELLGLHAAWHGFERFFPHRQLAAHWSGTAHENNPDFAWEVNFSTGTTVGRGKFHPLNVRLVRSAPE